MKYVRLSNQNKNNHHKDVEMTLEEYLSPLLKNFRDIRTIKKYRVCIQQNN